MREESGSPVLGHNEYVKKIDSLITHRLTKNILS